MAEATPRSLLRSQLQSNATQTTITRSPASRKKPLLTDALILNPTAGPRDVCAVVLQKPFPAGTAVEKEMPIDGGILNYLEFDPRHEYYDEQQGLVGLPDGPIGNIPNDLRKKVLLKMAQLFEVKTDLPVHFISPLKIKFPFSMEVFGKKYSNGTNEFDLNEHVTQISFDRIDVNSGMPEIIEVSVRPQVTSQIRPSQVYRGVRNIFGALGLGYGNGMHVHAPVEVPVAAWRKDKIDLAIRVSDVWLRANLLFELETIRLGGSIKALRENSQTFYAPVSRNDLGEFLAAFFKSEKSFQALNLKKGVVRFRGGAVYQLSDTNAHMYGFEFIALHNQLKDVLPDIIDGFVDQLKMTGQGPRKTSEHEAATRFRSDKKIKSNRQAQSEIGRSWYVDSWNDLLSGNTKGREDLLEIVSGSKFKRRELLDFNTTIEHPELDMLTYEWSQFIYFSDLNPNQIKKIRAAQMRALRLFGEINTMDKSTYDDLVHELMVDFMSESGIRELLYQSVGVKMPNN